MYVVVIGVVVVCSLYVLHYTEYDVNTLKGSCQVFVSAVASADSKQLYGFSLLGVVHRSWSHAYLVMSQITSCASTEAGSKGKAI